MAVAPVLHGIDTGGTTTTRPDGKTQHGAFYYDETLRRFLVFDENIGVYLPVDGGYYLGGQNLYDDFRVADAGAAVPINWNVNSGSGGTDPAQVALTGGALRLTGGSGDNETNDISLFTHGITWAADNGGLIFETKLKVDNIATVYIFAGFTDVIATTAEQPIEITGTTQSETATDAVGFLFDTDATDESFWCVGVNTGTGVTQVTSAIAPVNGTYITLRLELTTTGQCVYKINGTTKATIAAALAPAVAITPVVIVNSRAAAARLVDVDYVACFDRG